MISYQIYKLIHLAGIFLLFLSLGGLALHTMNGGTKATNTFRKTVAITHGISLVFILVAGFGLLARLGIPHANWPTWVYVKVVIWLLFGASIALVSKKPKLAQILWFVLPLLGLSAVYLAVYKPF